MRAAQHYILLCIYYLFDSSCSGNMGGFNTNPPPNVVSKYSTNEYLCTFPFNQRTRYKYTQLENEIIMFNFVQYKYGVHGVRVRLHGSPNMTSIANAKAIRRSET